MSLSMSGHSGSMGPDLFEVEEIARRFQHRHHGGRGWEPAGERVQIAEQGQGDECDAIPANRRPGKRRLC